MCGYPLHKSGRRWTDSLCSHDYGCMNGTIVKVKATIYPKSITGIGAEIIMNYTYIVKCADGTLYTGWTNCLKKRMKAHNEGKTGAKYTKTKRPVTLVYYEGFLTKEEAMRREYQIKQLARNKKLDLMKF